MEVETDKSIVPSIVLLRTECPQTPSFFSLSSMKNQSTDQCHLNSRLAMCGIPMSSSKHCYYMLLLVTSATLVVTGALLVVTMFAIRNKINSSSFLLLLVRHHLLLLAWHLFLLASCYY